jgi:hypothetical protein
MVTTKSKLQMEYNKEVAILVSEWQIFLKYSPLETS